MSYNARTYLPYLVGLGLASVALQVDLIFDAGFSKYVVASTNTFLEAQSAQELPEIVEGNVRVGRAAQYAIEKVVVFDHGIRLQQPYHAA